MRETDLLLGGFAEARLSDLDDALLDPFEALLEESDRDVLTWILGRAAPPARHDTALMRLLRDFNSGSSDH